MSEPAPAAPAAEPVAPAAPAPTPVAPASSTEPAMTQPTETKPAEGAQSYFTPAQLAEMETFYRNNGGYEKVFGVTKKAISQPEPKLEPQAAQPQPQPSQPQNVPQSGSQRPAEGIYTTQELAMAAYFDRVAKEPKYANISDEIASGAVLQEAKKLNVDILSPAGVNDRLLHDFLDMYSKSKPAKPTSAEPTASPQADYVKLEKVNSMEDANKIQLQNIQLRAQGLPEHPLTAEAHAFVRDYYSKKK